MAELIQLNDGSLLTYEKPEEIPEIIREKFSEDLSNKVRQLLEEDTEEDLLLKDELEGYEMSCEEYHDLLLDVNEKLEEIRGRIVSGKITKQKIHNELLELSERIVMYL